MTQRENLFQDLRTRFEGYDVQTVFDVGANIGQSAVQYRRYFPDAHIHCFEPVPASFELLMEQVREDAGVTANNHALGRDPGHVTMTAKGSSAANRIIDRPGKADLVQRVEIKRGDDYCAENGVDHIHFMKIDTEGHDLNVVCGFQKMLSDCRIDLLQVEASMNSTNAIHVGIWDFLGYLQPMGYHLLKVYDQVLELDGRPMLRRANPVFISPRLVEAYTIRKVKPPVEAAAPTPTEPAATEPAAPTPPEPAPVA